MGRKGGKRHLKRLPAPAFWPIQKKMWKWAMRPRAGPHSMDKSLPLGVIVRDLLKLARTGRESQLLISQGKIKVDGRVRTDYKYPVGLMDVVEIPEAKTRARMVPAPKKGLALVDIPKEESLFKLCRIKDKATVRKGNIQLNLHDARNLLVKVENPRNPVEDTYSTGDTLRINLPDQKIVQHLKFAQGSYVVVTAGRNVGKHGKIASIETSSANRPLSIEIQGSDGENFRTVAEYVFVVGETTPLIELRGQ